MTDKNLLHTLFFFFFLGCNSKSCLGFSSHTSGSGVSLGCFHRGFLGEKGVWSAALGNGMEVNK